MRERITNLARSGHSGLFIVSTEEARVQQELKAVAAAIGFELLSWSVTGGLVNVTTGESRQATDPLDVLEAAGELENAIVALLDFHTFLDEANPVLLRAMRDALNVAKSRGVCLVIVGCRQVIPAEIQREVTVVEFALPAMATLGQVLDGICESAGVDAPAGDRRDAILEAAQGLTTGEAENTFALSVVQAGEITPAIVSSEKAAAVAKGGLLNVSEVTETLDQVGGLDRLKDWLLQRRDAFTQRARDYRLPNPKGMLICGIPGTGKSLTARITASVFGRPLLALDAGRLFGSLVGESEQRVREVIALAEAISPAVLLIDELEKAFGRGAGGAGNLDGGASSRVFGTLLTWLNDHTSPVYVCCTCNDVSALPPELLRKGRFDELWFVDLPQQRELEAIWRIQIAKHGRDPDHYDLAALAKATNGFTGAEVEQAFVDAMYAAFDAGREPSDGDIRQAVRDTVPLSKLMAEQIQALRSWARNRARRATSPEPESKQRRIVA